LLIYLHGFNSSPQSFKARLLHERMIALHRGAEFSCPALDPYPRRAITQLEALIDTARGEPALVGSSLGGYYATYLSERHRLRTALINPAVRPYELLAQVIGPQRNLYTGAEYQLTTRHIEELRELEVEMITPENYLLVAATGDEALDYRMAVTRYGGAKQIVVKGGDHGFSDFAHYLDAVLDHCGVTPA
jgi:predicted esterase YcpF (UPF0227 family)